MAGVVPESVRRSLPEIVASPCVPPKSVLVITLVSIHMMTHLTVRIICQIDQDVVIARKEFVQFWQPLVVHVVTFSLSRGKMPEKPLVLKRTPRPPIEACTEIKVDG